MAIKYENSKRLLIYKMSWREYVAATESWGLCDCCGQADFDTGGYYIALIDSWFCRRCFDAYYGGAIRTKVDIAKEQENWVKMTQKLRDLGCLE